MTGSITNIEQLERWFRSANLPFFTLKYSGTGDKIIFRNETWEDLEDAWEQLRNQVEAQASAGRAMLEILVYKKGGANHPMRTNVDIRPGYYPATAGISGPVYPGQMPGIGTVQEYVAQQVKIAMLERDNRDLQDAVNNPANTWERVLDRIAESPQLAGIAQIFVSGLVSRFAPAAPVSVAVPVNGVPGDPEAYPDAMYDNLEEAAQILGTSPEAIAAKVAYLVKQNPDIAKTLLQ